MVSAAALSKPKVKPLLRGYSHGMAFVAALGCVGLLVTRVPAGAAFWCALVYGGSVATLFGTSALYHLPYWSLSARRILKPMDHSAIFVLIAGTFTPFSVVLGAQGTTLLAVGWTGAALGVARAFFWHNAPKKLVAAQALATGWVAVWFFPALSKVLDRPTIELMALGGALYSVGAVIFAFRRPNPWPRIFGFHEIFHLLVVAAAAAHFAAVWRILGAG